MTPSRLLPSPGRRSAPRERFSTMEIPVKRFLKLGVITMGLVVVASSFIHPYGPVKTAQSSAPLMAGAGELPKSLEFWNGLARIATLSARNGHGTAIWRRYHG